MKHTVLVHIFYRFIESDAPTWQGFLYIAVVCTAVLSETLIYHAAMHREVLIGIARCPALVRACTLYQVQCFFLWNPRNGTNISKR